MGGRGSTFTSDREYSRRDHHGNMDWDQHEDQRGFWSRGDYEAFFEFYREFMGSDFDTEAEAWRRNGRRWRRWSWWRSGTNRQRQGFAGSAEYEYQRRFQGRRDSEDNYHRAEYREFGFAGASGMQRLREKWGLPEGYSQVALKSAYRRLARKAHPDVGGTNEAMKQVNQEHEWLKRGYI